MNYLHQYENKIKLYVPGHVSADDAKRQEVTAREILKRLSQRPGVIVADEVGMGKTFVALATAVSVALNNRGKRPVVIMVPPSLKEKWPADFKLFREKCLPPELSDKIRYGRAERPVQFLKLLDDPPRKRRAIIFLTHGAMSRRLADRWVMLAIIQQALKWKRDVTGLRSTLCKIMGTLLHMKWVERNGSGIWDKLLNKHPSRWLKILHDCKIDPENDDDPDTDDDPVPRAVYQALPRLDTSRVFEALQSIPLHKSTNYETRLRQARKVITDEMRTFWKQCVVSLKLKLPLLILDEAHHLKNPETEFASLFRAKEAYDDAEEVRGGHLARVFERMLFLTATPFQLGHRELLSVLERFGDIAWQSRIAPKCGKDGFEKELQELRDSLDAAQEASLALDSSWGRLTQEDLLVDENRYEDVDSWWASAMNGSSLSPLAREAIRCYERAKAKLTLAESKIKPLVIRHLRSRVLPEPYQRIKRRKRLAGKSICIDNIEHEKEGISINGDALLPFLLAARAASHAPSSRPVFAEGLASSYEAFMHTRQMNKKGRNSTDSDDSNVQLHTISNHTDWYLKNLEAILPLNDPKASAAHPKLSATVNRVVDIWKKGEKSIVFCHYIATGRILRQRVSNAIEQEIKQIGSEKLNCDQGKVMQELERIGDRFFKKDSPLRIALDETISDILTGLNGYHLLREHHDDILDVVRRNVRTPSFLVRFFPLDQNKLTGKSVYKAMKTKDQSRQTLKDLLKYFFEFLIERCGKSDRERYLDAIDKVQTGSIYGAKVAQSFNQDELQGDRPERLIPNVRLANGTTRQDTRQRLMLTFNTPFFPEVLVASSVMAEGVDLHLNCRHVIHHDLCWNPSTLEQRTGRIDRIGAKVERCGQPIHIYLPFLSETQDEKMYRVVMDRERWFNVVMGEDYKMDAKTTEKLANRIQLPMQAMQELSFNLEV